MVKEIIKVFYYGKKNNDPLYIFWKKIQKKMENKGYKFIIQETEIEPDWDGIIQKVEAGIYDISISSYYITHKRMEKIYFPYPLSTAQSFIVNYDKKKNFIFIFIKFTFYIIILLLVLALIFSYIYFKYYNEKNYFSSLYKIFPSFFGTTGGLLRINLKNSKKIIILNIITFLILFFVSVSLMGILIARFISIKQKTNILSSIKNKKIVISEGASDVDMIKHLGGIDIIYGKQEKKKYKNVIEFYLLNSDIYDGLYADIWDFLGYNYHPNTGINYKLDNKTYNLIPSLIDTDNYLISFPINKKKKNFIKDINNIFTKSVFDEYGKICQKLTNNNQLIMCPNVFL